MDESKAMELVSTAKKARDNAYTPYSHYRVGAALLAKDGRIYTGCNIENAAFGPTICAERTAIFKAVSEGLRDFEAIAVAGGPEGELSDDIEPAYPCGVCRQVMMEFMDPETFTVITASGKNGYESRLLKELLPMAFGPSNLS